MGEASHHDRRILLVDDVSESATTAAHYLAMVQHYHRLNNLAGMMCNLRCGEACLRAAQASVKTLETLDTPVTASEAAE